MMVSRHDGNSPLEGFTTKNDAWHHYNPIGFTLENQRRSITMGLKNHLITIDAIRRLLRTGTLSVGSSPKW